jgi:hypothetical protein
MAVRTAEMIATSRIFAPPSETAALSLPRTNISL